MSLHSLFSLVLFALMLPLTSRADDRSAEELERLRKEARLLKERLQERERQILELSQQAGELEKRIQEVLKELARVKVGAQPRFPKKEMFPAVDVEGTVRRLDKQENLVLISLGSDAGLMVGHTLHVYRLDPRPEMSKYLGKIEIVNLKGKDAVARPLDRLKTEEIKLGDKVASRLGEK
jgi:hypothetical protein